MWAAIMYPLYSQPRRDVHRHLLIQFNVDASNEARGIHVESLSGPCPGKLWIRGEANAEVRNVKACARTRLRTGTLMALHLG